MTTNIDSFSWKRTWMVARYWWPNLRVQFWAYIAAAVLIALAGGFLDKTYNTFTRAYIVSLTIWLACLGSAIFGRSRGRDFNISLPALSSEKLTVVIIYGIVILPLISLGLCHLIYDCILGVDSDVTSLKMRSYLSGQGLYAEGISDITKMVPLFVTVNIVVCITLSMITLTGALFYKRHAVIKSIATSIGCNFIPSILMGLAGGFYGFYKGYTAPEGTDLDITQLQHLIMNEVIPVFEWSLIFSGIIVTVILMIVIIRRYRTRQSL